MKAAFNSPILDDPKQYMLSELGDSEHDKELMKSERTIFDLPEVKDIPGQEHIKVMPFGEIADVTISSDDEEGVGILDFDDDDLDEDEDVLTEVDDEDDDEDDVMSDDDDDALMDDEEAGELGDDDFDDDFDDDDLEEDDIDDDLPVASANGSPGTEGDDLDEPDMLDDETTDADITPEEIELLDEGGPVEIDSDTDNLNRSKLDDTDMEGDPLNEASSGANKDGSELDVVGSELDNDDEAIGEEDEENNMYSKADTD